MFSDPERGPKPERRGRGTADQSASDLRQDRVQGLGQGTGAGRRQHRRGLRSTRHQPSHDVRHDGAPRDQRDECLTACPACHLQAALLRKSTADFPDSGLGQPFDRHGVRLYGRPARSCRLACCAP